MKLFNKGKRFLSIFVILLMLVQLVAPAGNYGVSAEEGSDDNLPTNIEENLLTGFSMTITDKDGKQTNVENGSDLTVDLERMNAISLDYKLERPDDVELSDGDTYTIDLPSFFTGSVVDQPIQIGEVDVATYSIIDGKIIITFNENVDTFDDAELRLELTGSFNTTIFEDVEEVVVDVPFKDGDSFTTTVRPKGDNYDAQDKKTAGFQYVLKDGEKVKVDRNPGFIDWTVLANDAMNAIDNAKIVDELGDNLEIVKDSIKVERILRNYKNEEIGREEITPTNIAYTDNGFELDLGAIDHAYEVSYTTKLIRPEGGKTHTIKNKANIILDGDIKEVEDKFDGTWSGDLPIISKKGEETDNPHVLNWSVEYNFGKENLGTVNLTDALTHGKVDLDSVKVHEVDVDVDGNIVANTKVEVTKIVPSLNEEGKLTIPDLDAEGKAYYITYSSSVPVGKDTTVTNTISDNKEDPNIAQDSVDVNTIPTGGKVGEQKIDDEGKPYIEWTITLNSQKVDVGSITIRDVFNQDYLDFDVENDDLFDLYKDDTKSTNFTIEDYTHTDGREGFKLDIKEAGPHTYKFVYKTYYTVEGMQQPKLANSAELVFLDGDGNGIGNPVEVPDAVLEGPKAGISKEGKYVLNDDGNQEIQWSVTLNKSKILLNKGSTITENFLSGNFEYIKDTLILKEVDGNDLKKGTDYSFSLTGETGFEITLLKATNKKLLLTFKSTVDNKNLDHTNKVTLTWEGGAEPAEKTVAKRDPGINKSGVVVINDDGSKTVNWTVDFNTKKNVIHDFQLTDDYTPTTVTVSDIKIMAGVEDVTKDFKISEELTGGKFTVEKNRLEAKVYQLTYSTTLSPKEEQADFKNTASIEYTGGSDKSTKTISKPDLKVEKSADGVTKEKDKNPVITWTIHANTDSANKYVNLVDSVLEDTIPEDQKLVLDSVKAVRKDDATIEVPTDMIKESDNSFIINLPNGPYEYAVTYETEILQLPSLDGEVFDRYNNAVTLKNQTKNGDLKQDDSDDAWIRYYNKNDNNLTGKSGSQNDDTENIDYEVTINPEGLTIHNAKVVDTLSENHAYVEDSIKLFDSKGDLMTDGFTLKVAEDKRSFDITFANDSNVNGTIDSKYSIKYSTRLNDNLVGTYDVTNNVVLTGGTQETELHSTSIPTTAQQWFYGGGGSGRTVKLQVNKFDNKVDTPDPIKDVAFKLERVNLNGERTEIDTEIKTNEHGIFIKDGIRAGRYVLTEVSAPGLYKKLSSPIHFLIGYTQPNEDGEEVNPYTIEITDGEWKKSDHSHASAEGNTLTIKNDFKETSHQFITQKSLKGTDLVADEFEFILSDAKGVEISRARNDSNGKVTFDSITYDQPGRYEYTMVEVKGDRKGMTYDESEIGVTLTVVEGEKGLEVSSVVYASENEGLDNKFINKYQPLATELAFTANKKLSGRDMLDREFDFEIYATNEDYQAMGDPVGLATNDADGLVEFEAITYNKVGTYNYLMREVSGDKDTVTYDDTEIYFTVTVEDNEGQLVTALEISGGKEFTFDNSYTPHSTDLKLEITKELLASSHLEVGGRELAAGEFEFELLNEAGDVIATATNNLDGNVEFTLENYFKEVGEYKLTVREVAGDDSTINYSTKEIGASVSVTDQEGQLVALVGYDEGDSTFTNVEKTYAIGDYTWIDANKDGIQDEDELVLADVIVELYNKDGKKIDETSTNSEGLYIFDELVAGDYKIKFVLTEEQAKLYEFTKEVAGNNSTDNSDANPLTGWTTDIVLNDENEHLTKSYESQDLLATQGIDPTWDAGVILRARTNVSVEKEWVGGPAEKDPVFVQLKRNGLSFGELIELNEDNDWAYTFRDLYVTSKNHESYTYTVEEVQVDKYTSEISGDAKDGFIITNTYNKREITGSKIWIDGPKTKPSIELQLFKNGEELGDPVTLKDGETEYTWKDLDLRDQSGVEYVYSVDEVDVPENYGKSRSEDGLSITNTYESPLGDVTGRKVWINGPEIKPTIELQLYQDGEKFGDPVELMDGQFEFVWKDLQQTDANGEAYEYTVKEVDTPANYIAIYDGLTATNMYVSPKTEFQANKVWISGPKVKPTIDLQLYRDGQAFGDPVQLFDGDVSYLWTDLDLTDEKGHEYSYTVDELNVPENYSKKVDGGTITNTHQASKAAEKDLPTTGMSNKESLMALSVVGLGSILLLPGLLKRKRREKKNN